MKERTIKQIDKLYGDLFENEEVNKMALYEMKARRILFVDEKGNIAKSDLWGFYLGEDGKVYEAGAGYPPCDEGQDESTYTLEERPDIRWAVEGV